MPWVRAVSEIALHCENLRYRYQPNEDPVFENISLTVKKGETVLLMGPSGCGKSTLAYCLAGLYPEYAGSLEGSIEVFGENLQAMNPAQRARKISIMFQNPDNQFCMSNAEHEVLFALENINFQGDFYQRLDDLLNPSGLLEVKSEPIHTLSGGTKQKIALATAQAVEAKVLILDEPFANIDPAACTQLAARLAELNRAGITLIIVDHRLDYWRTFLSRVLIMDNNGRLLNDGILARDLDQNKTLFESLGLFYGDEWLEQITPPIVLSPRESIVEASNLSACYGKKPFLSELNFAIEKGSITSLVGSNGSGKSTLLGAIAGLVKHKGKLEVCGQVGLVFQNPRFQFLTLKVRTEVEMTLQVCEPDKSAAEIRAAADEMLSRFGLADYAEVSPYELSQGQQRRLAIISMLAGQKDLLLLDEPTYAQDEQATSFIMQLLAEKVEQGLSAVIATHDLALARRCANRILLLADGKLQELLPAQFEQYAAEVLRAS